MVQLLKNEKTLHYSLSLPYIGHFSHVTKNRPGQIARPMPIGRAGARKISEMRPIFRARRFCLLERKKSLDLQIYSRIRKTMKKLL